MRASALFLAACAAPSPSPVAAVSAPRPVPAAAPALPAPVLDTSIATTWGFDPDRREGPSPFAPKLEEPEREHIASAVPRARLPGRRAPCFPKRDVLVAAEAYRDLAGYLVSIGDNGEELSPRGRYGTCTVADAKVRDARGTLVGELGCGFVAYVPGIIDELGFEVGAKGSDVANALPSDGEPLCMANGTTQSRCWFKTSGDDDHPYLEYYFAATFTSDDGVLRGKAARKLFDSHQVVAFAVNAGDCH